jgi:hypothetical protein
MSYKIKKDGNVVVDSAAWLAPEFNYPISYYIQNPHICDIEFVEDGSPIVKSRIIVSKLLQVLFK